MNITININDIKPVYEQIVFQIEQGVKSGQLLAGALLPSIRQLAVDLDVNHNTIAKAYQILESHRIIKTAGRRGTFINKDADNHAKYKTEQNAVIKMSDLISTLEENGLNKTEIKNVFNLAMKATV